ncbi:MAG: hypothetical protein RBT78_06415 [Kiritimatiellia bacterium]|nr:hypothetical protein [Kiritimatiellia bacterium]
MTRIRRRLCSGFTVAGLLCVGFPGQRCLADVVFQADFSGPGNSRSGGPYDSVTTGGVLGELKSDAYTFTRVIGENPMASAGGYLSCSIVSNTSGSTLNAVKFSPNASSNSLNAMTSVIGDDRVLNGAIDFFFRSDRDITKFEFRPLDVDNRSAGGLRFNLLSSQMTGGVPSLKLEVQANADGLRSGGDTGALVSGLSAEGPFAMLAGTVYHLGLTFATDAEGTVTAKVWGQAGTNEIDLATAAPVATLTFGVNEAVVVNGLPTGDFYLGQFRYVNIPLTMRQEFDRFRIHNATPAVFGPLEATAGGEADTDSALVLQADFSGPGGGTGGKGDLVTVGGTAVLADAGAYSDASVSTNEPFLPYAGGYLSVLTTNNVAEGVYARAVITPASEASSLAAMSLVTNGQRILRGGLDFFFRADRTPSVAEEFRPIDSDNRGAGGLRLILASTSTASQMMLQILAPSGSSGIQIGGAGGAWGDGLTSYFIAPVQAGTLYHAGISFHADGDSGYVTAAVWLKEGAGAIDLRRDIPVCAATFGLSEATVTQGLTSGFFDIGKLRKQGTVPNRQDFDCLRVYRGTPAEFAGLPSPAPRGTLIGVR